MFKLNLGVKSPKIKVIAKLFIIVIAVVGIRMILPDRYIKVTQLNCKSQFGECSKYVSDKLINIKGKPIYAAKKSVTDTFRNLPQIEHFTFQFKLPGTLEILVKERKPEFAGTKDFKDFYIVDDSGLVLYQNTSTSLPVLFSETSEFNVGQKVAGDKLFALQLLRDLNTSLDVKKGTLKDNSLVIELKDNLQVIFPLEGERDVLTGSLILLYSRVQEGGTLFKSDTNTLGNVSSIDLRYKNPVLRVN